MGISTSLVVFAVGAILRFAVSAVTTGYSVHNIGVILMIVGAVGLLLSIGFWSSWGGFGGLSHQRRTSTSGPTGTTTTLTEERQS